MDAATFAAVLANRDEALAELEAKLGRVRQENGALRAECRRLRARHRDDTRRGLRLAGGLKSARARAGEAEAAMERVIALFPRSDPRPFLAAVGTDCEGLTGNGSGEDAMAVAELRAKVKELEAKVAEERRLREDDARRIARLREDDARRIAQLTGELDGLAAQVSALTAGEDDGTGGLSSWMLGQ